MRQNNEFIKVSAPNMDELSKLVSKAKGPVRSIREFAKECGVSASTLTRIINKDNKGASSQDLIRTIAKKAVPESGVTLDALMGANGMARILAPSAIYRVSEMEIEEKFKDTILYTLRYIDDLDYISEGRFQIGMSLDVQLDFVIYSKAIKDGSSLWGFELVHPQISRRIEEDRIYTFRMYSNQILKRIGKILPLFYNNDKQLGKLSFVVTDDKCYDYLVSEFENCHMPFNMSFIKFNCHREIIEHEYILKQPDGKIPKSILRLEENYE